MVLTGAYHAELARLAAWSLVNYFNKFLGIEASVGNFTIRNIVSSFHLGFHTDLAALKLELGSRVRYDPDRFPAAIFASALHAKVVALLYDSGNGVLTGCKTFDEVKTEYINVYSVASLFVRGKKNNFKRREFRELQAQQLRKEAGSLDAPDAAEEEGPEAAKAKLQLVLNAYREVTGKRGRGLGKKLAGLGAGGMDDLGLPSELAGLMLGADGSVSTQDDPSGLSAESILQLIVPADVNAVGTVATPGQRVPVTSLDSICYVDTSGFVHLVNDRFGDLSCEGGGSLPEYQPISLELSKRPSEDDKAEEEQPLRRSKHKHRHKSE